MPRFYAGRRDAAGLPFHVARKKVAHLDERGEKITPASPNAIKFERFIFDLMPLAKNPLVVETDAARTFAAVKNAPGEKTETPQTCQSAMMALHREWLSAAGAKVTENVDVEISPLFALDAGEVQKKIQPGTVVSQPTYFQN